MISLSRPRKFHLWVDCNDGCLRLGNCEFFWSNPVGTYRGQFSIEIAPVGDYGYILWGAGFGLSCDFFLFGRHFYKEGRTTLPSMDG